MEILFQVQDIVYPALAFQNALHFIIFEKFLCWKLNFLKESFFFLRNLFVIKYILFAF